MNMVYIGGMGLVSGAGTDVETHGDFFRNGRTGSELSVDIGMASRLAPARKMLKFMSKSAMLMEMAAIEALGHIDLSDYSAERIGLYAASGLAGGNLPESLAALEAGCENGVLSFAKFNRDGLKALNPLMSFQVLANMPGCIVSVLHKIKGDHLLFNPFEDQAANALFEGYVAVANGIVDAALVLAGDDPAQPANLAYLRHNGILPDADVPNPAGAAIWLTAAPENAVARIEWIDMAYDHADFFDPLLDVFGRMVASAPPAQMILSAAGIELPCRISANGQTLQWRLAR